MSDFLNKYPYTDFHELNLDWVIERVKQLTEDWLTTQDAWNDTQEQWQHLYDYVHDYFDNLDVSQEISDKIDAMVSNGTFLNIIKSTVETQTITTTTSWLADHITQPTTPVIDASLTIAGAAADAKKTGLLTAPAYDSTATYTINSYCNYNGTIYRCIRDIPTPQAWTASNWSATNTGRELTTLKNIFYDGYNYSYGYYWENSNNTLRLSGNGLFTQTSAFELIPVKNGDSIYIHAEGTGIAYTYYICDDTLGILSDRGNASLFDGIVNISNASARFIAVNMKNSAMNDCKIFKLNNNSNYYNILESDIYSVGKAWNYSIGYYWEEVSNAIRKGGGGSFTQNCAFDPIRIKNGQQIYVCAQGTGIAYSYFITASDGSVLTSSGDASRVNDIITVNDASAAYLYINMLTAYIDETKAVFVNNSNLWDKTLLSEKLTQINICCTGDSTTEGMLTNGAHTADYGKSPYPARLKTLLVDNGYNHINVFNYGHGGEKMAPITARIGGMMCYFTENVTIPADGTDVDITNKIAIPCKDSNNNDYTVYFTQLSSDTNPIFINGISYTMVISGNMNKIHKTVNDNEQTIITAGTMLFTADNKNAAVNIFYGGINDGSDLTLAAWLEQNKKNGETNGGKYIVIGSTRALWENWSDVTGATPADKYAYYSRQCWETFGIHFLDLYKDWFENALDYALDSGYFTNKTQQELNAMAALLAQHIVPAEFSYDDAHQGDVHLNEAGYQVIGMLLFDRLKRLNYI